MKKKVAIPSETRQASRQSVNIPPTNRVSGIGSSLAVLVFSVLCLTVLSLISLSASSLEKSLAEASARMVKGYYEADILAEQIISEVIAASQPPQSVKGVDISYGGGKTSFICPIYGDKGLFVEIVVAEDSYEVLQWRVLDAGEWEIDGGLPVWSGE